MKGVGKKSRTTLSPALARDPLQIQRRVRNTPKRLAAYDELATIYKESGQSFRSMEVLECGLQNVDDKSAGLKSLIRTGYEAQDFAKVKSYYEQLLLKITNYTDDWSFCLRIAEGGGGLVAGKDGARKLSALPQGTEEEGLLQFPLKMRVTSSGNVPTDSAPVQSTAVSKYRFGEFAQ
jgi:hypothetical protein